MRARAHVCVCTCVCRRVIRSPHVPASLTFLFITHSVSRSEPIQKNEMVHTTTTTPTLFQPPSPRGRFHGFQATVAHPPSLCNPEILLQHPRTPRHHTISWSYTILQSTKDWLGLPHHHRPPPSHTHAPTPHRENRTVWDQRLLELTDGGGHRSTHESPTRLSHSYRCVGRRTR